MNDLTGAACDGMPVSAFFGHEERRGLGRAGIVDRARAVCRSCPVQAKCLAYAMEIEQPRSRYGIWGGYTADERDQLGRRSAA